MPHVPIALVLSIAAGLFGAGHVGSRFLGRYPAVTMVIALGLATPVAALLVMRFANDRPLATTSFSETWAFIAWVAIIGLWWSGLVWGWVRGRPHRRWSASGRHASIVLAGFGLIALAIWLGTIATVMRDRWRQQATLHDQLVRRWHRDEEHLRACVAETGRASAETDAAASVRHGDHRLLGIYSLGQEAATFDVLGISSADGTVGIGSPPTTVLARLGRDTRWWRIAVRQTPIGMGYTDPWGFSRRAMGREPDSAAACNAATRRYVAAYNQAILRAGVAKQAVSDRLVRSRTRR